jgi:hypothetical protein
MISFDANVIVHSLNKSTPAHEHARAFLLQMSDRDDVAIAEYVLVEVYLLIRNPAVFPHPFSARDATDVCEGYRRNPRWRLVEHLPVMDEVWRRTAAATFARRKIVDARLALTLRAAGVTEFATSNVKHFEDFGFDRVWDPLQASL